MRILVAPDKFKDSLGAAEVAECIAAGLRDVLPKAEITLLPVSDGGEGFASVICGAANGVWHECEVHDPLGRLVRARYCTIGATAVMEMSEASGLWRLSPNERNPVVATTFGTGEMLLDAARHGVQEIVIGLGGSATNDGGFGMARSLGCRFLDREGAELTRVDELGRLAEIERPAALRIPAIVVAADVRNHLLGEHGATHTFARQKGASAAQIILLEDALGRLADTIARTFGIDRRAVDGAGAAGGLAFGLISFCDAKIRSGFDVVAKHIGLENAVRAADIVITGEGKLDAQTLAGKAPAGVARLARENGKPVFAIVGSAEKDSEILFDQVWILSRLPVSAREAIADASNLLRVRAREVARVLQKFRSA